MKGAIRTAVVERAKTRSLRSFVAIVVTAGVAAVAWAQGGPDPLEPGPVDKILSTMEAAVAVAPLIDLQRSRLAAEVATVRSTAGAGTTWITWQSEGIGAGFNRDPNATDYLRLSLPFNRPWDLVTNRELRDASDRWQRSGEHLTVLEVAALTGRLWLDLAAATAQEDLARARFERLEKAVTIQRKRFELGEISGSERRQLELALARETALLEQATARRLAAQREIEVLAGSGLASPGAGDLAALVEATKRSLDPAGASAIPEGPALQFASDRAELAALEARRQRATAYGLPEVEMEWERIPDLGVVEGFDSYGFSLAIPLPIGRQGNQKARAFEMSSVAAAAEHELLRQQLRARFETAFEIARGAEAALEALEPYLAEAITTERSLTEQFRLGAISYLVYLDGFSRLDDVIRSAIESRHALLIARLDLAEISGSNDFFPLPRLESEGGS